MIAGGIAALKAELDRLRALHPGGTPNFDHVQDLELTYTSNAIEGNTLTAVETTLVIEQGITIAGKPLRDHLEALDHFDALRYVRTLASTAAPLTELDLRRLHQLVMARSDPEHAGRYADQGRYVLTGQGRHAFPSPVEVPALMEAFARWLTAADPAPLTAFAAHLRLVQIHPFNDGNGRTARLLMNLVLIRAGYPPIPVRPVDRPAYLAALDRAGTDPGPFTDLLTMRLDEALRDMIADLRQRA